MNKPRHVLLIDGDAFYANIMREHLKREGFEVCHAPSGERGVEEAKEQLPDIILLAIRLPKKDGFEILEALKSDPKTSSIPVAMLTELGKAEDVQYCFARGVCDYLIKSQQAPEEISARIRKILRCG